MHNFNRGTHLATGTPVYWAWQGMKRHCYNKKDGVYKYIGGLGIKVCEPWLTDFQTWRDDVGEPSKDKPVLDRIDHFKNYQPGNTQWASAIEMRQHRYAHIEELYLRKFHVKLLNELCLAKTQREWRRITKKSQRSGLYEGWSDFKRFLAEVGVAPRPYARLVKKKYDRDCIYSPDNVEWSLAAVKGGEDGEE